MSEQQEISAEAELLLPTEDETKTNVVKPYFAPGSSADHDQGVLYQGDYQNESDGTATAIRLHALALAQAGAPLLLKPFTARVLSSDGVYEPLWKAGVPKRVEEQVGTLTNTSIHSLFPAIRHFVIHKPEDISRRLMRGTMGHLDDPELLLKARKSVYGSTALYSVWERDRVDDVTARELRRMGDVWVPCQQNADMLRSCGVENVFVVPHPYEESNPLLHLTRRRPIKEKRFYWIGRWEPRKNPVLLLESFCEAFSPEDDAHLTMKFHGQWEGYPTFEQTVEHIVEEGKWTRDQLYAKITPVEGFLRPDQIVKLHYENNIYVAPSSGEAWCLPAFEAKLAGNKLIHTPYGGTADFADNSTDLSIFFSMEKVPESYGWPPGSLWAQPDASSLTAYLKNSAVPQSFERPAYFNERYSMEAIGLRMKDRIRQVWGEAVRW